MPTESNQIAGLYNIGKTIGKGHFAVVKEARHVFTQEKVAIKIIDKTKLDKISQDQLLSEVMCMKLVQHPNIVRLYEVIDTVNKLYLVLELGDGGDLYDYLLNNGSNGLPEEEAKHYFRQILRALAYCHKLHVVHRDIKPENVVFFKQSELVKLTDFGFSNKFIPGETLNTSCGSLAYSAPEILLGDSYDAPKVDIWSLGVILFMLVIGSLPFNETNDSETIANIMDCKYTVPSRVSESCRNLIGKMLKRDASQRSSLDNIINDDWLRFQSGSLEYEIENYSIPLISQEHLTLEEHIEILTKMSDGNLATVEDTQRILDNEEYNHISATYFLLAERKLKRNYVDKYIQLKSRHKCEMASKEESKSNPSSARQVSMEGIRRISMILEGEETEENEENDAMASLATVRRELENFMGGIDTERLSGTVAPNSSRCVSRINSVYDLHSTLDGYDSDTGIITNRSRNIQIQKSYRSFSSFSSQISTTSPVPKDLIDGIISEYSRTSEYPPMRDRKRKLPERLTLSLKPLNKKSRSVTGLASHYHPLMISDHVDLRNNLHKFSAISNQSSRRFLNNNNKYAAVQQVAMNDRKVALVFFDTGSNSTSANCSSPDISDIEGDSKSKGRYQKSSLKKMDSRTSDLFGVHDICEPINEEDEVTRSHNLALSNSTNNDHKSQYCFRSRSFDGRFANMIHVDTSCEKPVIVLRSDNRSWHSNSISRRLADSNFSLSSFASKLDQPNMMQVIRGTFELQIRNHHENQDGSKSMPRNFNPFTPSSLGGPLSDLPTIVSSPKSSAKQKNSHKFKIFNSRFRIPSLFNSHKDRKEGTTTPLSQRHSKFNSSNSCHVLNCEQLPKSDFFKNHVVNATSTPQLSFTNRDSQKEKTHLVAFKRDHLACCTVS